MICPLDRIGSVVKRPKVPQVLHGVFTGTGILEGFGNCAEVSPREFLHTGEVTCPTHVRCGGGVFCGSP